MRLVEIQIRKFRNFIDSDPIQIQPDVTCLVGKNESGKTACLTALYFLNPARSNKKFSIADHYPAWLEKRDRLDRIDLDKVTPIKAEFVMDDSDMALIREKFGEKVLTSNRLSLSRNYKGTIIYSLDLDEQAAVKEFVSRSKLPKKIADGMKGIKTFDDLKTHLETLNLEKVGSEENLALVKKLAAALKSLLADKNFSLAVHETVEAHVPQFFYFDEYSKLPYSVDIAEVLKTDKAELEDDVLTARSLLTLAAADSDYLLNPDYERRKRELENVANAITDDVLRYWTQNPELRVQPDITQKTQRTSQGQQSVLDELKIRIWDQRHSLSLPFDEHSTGFQWFFSFLAAFSEFESSKSPVIILLDEPALGLHARAQADFLRFIDERLAVRCQVLYTTHSPFMVQPGKLERVRLVEDKGRTHGAKITADVLTTDPDTLFPLQGALGYDLVQHLFIAPHNLIVEGTADFTYLQLVSDHLKGHGRDCLDEKWSIIPVGGVEMIPTFVALLGIHLDITVLVDAKKGGHQRLTKIASEGLLSPQRIITIGSITGKPAADIEDLFEPEEYLMLFNKAFRKTLKFTDLAGTDPIVMQIARAIGKDSFNHGLPADVFLRERDKILPTLEESTLRRFESLFSKVNATLPKK